MALEDWLAYSVAAKQGPLPHSNDGRVARLTDENGDINIDNIDFEAAHSILIDVRGFRFVPMYLDLVSTDSITFDWQVFGTSKEFNKIDSLEFTDFDIDVNAVQTTKTVINVNFNLPNAGKSGVSSALILALRKDNGLAQVKQAAVRVRQNL